MAASRRIRSRTNWLSRCCIVLNARVAAATSEGPRTSSGGMLSPRPKRSEASASERRERVWKRTQATVTSETASAEMRKESTMGRLQMPGRPTTASTCSQRWPESGTLSATTPSPGRNGWLGPPVPRRSQGKSSLLRSGQRRSHRPSVSM